MSARFVNVDRNTPMLLPPRLQEWIAEHDMVHFVIQAVERLPLVIFGVNERGTGDRQFPPHMMLALLIYCYANGNFSSRKIERATYRDIGVRFLTADTHPDHDTICKFRRDNEKAINAAFVEVLALAKELNILKVGRIAIDGTHIKANASIDQNVTLERACALKERLRKDVEELMLEAEKADNTETEDDQKLQKEIARRKDLEEKMVKVIAEFKKRDANQNEKEQVELEQQVARAKQSMAQPQAAQPQAAQPQAAQPQAAQPQAAQPQAAQPQAAQPQATQPAEKEGKKTSRAKAPTPKSRADQQSGGKHKSQNRERRSRNLSLNAI